MVIVAEQLNVLALADFIRLYDEEGAFEFIDGERAAVSPTVIGHVVITKILFLALHASVSTNNLGEVFTEAPFVLSDVAGWVKGSRVPDVMFFSAAKLDAYKAANPDWREKPAVLLPDLVVEIISANDRYSEVLKKVLRYLDDGITLVWIIDPGLRTVTFYQQNQRSLLRTADDTLDGGTVIPGFTLKVSALFV